MKQQDVSPAERLDAELAIQAMRRRERLWQTAQGRFAWVEAIGMLLAVLLIGAGLLEMQRGGGLGAFLRSNQGAGSLLFGLLMLGSFMWSHTQRQVNALLELLKQLELDRSRGGPPHGIER